MTNDEIEQRLGRIVKAERELTRELLLVLAEALRNETYLARGYGSLFDWLVQGFGYSGGAAYRRIESARLLMSVPEAREAFEAGEVNLSTMSQLQSALRKQPQADKRKLLNQIKNKSQKETERILAGEFPQEAPTAIKYINDTQALMVVDQELIDLLEKTKLTLSHAKPNATNLDILKLALTKLTSAAESQRSKRDKTLREKAGHRCEYRDPKTKHRCNSRYQLETDHIHPKGIGGSDDPSNLQTLCRKHNQYRAKQTYGARATGRAP